MMNTDLHVVILYFILDTNVRGSKIKNKGLGTSSKFLVAAIQVKKNAEATQEFQAKLSDFA